MLPSRSSPCLCAAALLVAATALAAQSRGLPPDAMPQRLLLRLAQPVAAWPADGPAAPRVLFTASGDDNAASLAVHPDANGDGVPDVAVGWDIFQTGHNLYMLDGAGIGDSDVHWSLESADGISGGYFYSDDGIVAFPDVNGDGIDELLTGTAGGGRAATLYDGASGAVLQSFDTYLGVDSGWVYAVVAVGDVNANGTPDFALAVGSDDDAVYMVDGGATGTHHGEIWRHQGLDAFFAVDVVGDIDGDGRPDVVAGSGDSSDDVVALSGATGAQLWHRNMGENVWHLRAYPDANADGVDEVLVGIWDTDDSVFLLDGASGATLWASPVTGTLTMRVVPLDDVDGDGRPDVAVASWADSVFVLSGLDGSLLWSSPTGGDVWAVDRVDDVTGDGISEVAFGSFDARARLADGVTGAVLWSHDANGHKVLRIRGAPDLDGDGAPEVVAGAQQLGSAVEPLLWVLDADSGVPGGNPELTWSGSAALGGAIQFDYTGAAPGATAYWIVGLDPALVPLAAPAVWLALDPDLFVVLFALAVPGGGADGFGGVVPADPLLDGIDVHVQVIALDVLFPPEGASANRIGLTLGG